MTGCLILKVDQVATWLMYFFSSMMLVSVFSKRITLTVKRAIVHIVIAGMTIGIYHTSGIDKPQVLYIILCFILIHVLYKSRVWEFCVTQSVHFIIFTFGWVVLDYIGEALNLGILRLTSIAGVVALLVSGVAVNVFKGSFLYYKDKNIYISQSWYYKLFYCIVSIAIVLTANIGIIIYREGIIFKGGDIKIPLISYIALVGLIICYLKCHKVVVKVCEQEEAEMIKSFSAKQLEAYRHLECLEREGQLIEEEIGEQVATLMGIVEEEQVEYVKPYVEAIQSQLIGERTTILTGNGIVDTIIKEKYKLACEKHIFISVNISLPEKLQVDVGDLCLMIGHTIDYALEACEKITMGKGQKVKIQGIWYKGYIIFRIWYSKARSLEVEEKLSVEEETRLAVENDQYGLGAVMKCLEKYDGKLELYTEGKWHKLEIYFNTMK